MGNGRDVMDIGAGGPEQLSMLASALVGRTVAVAWAEPGELSWTDGSTIFVEEGAGSVARLQGVAVQACLLAAGSLRPDLIRKLIRKPDLARRYLAVEGQRVLVASEDLLPIAVRPLLDAGLGRATASPEESLDLASGRQPLTDPPPSFGTLKARKLVSSSAATQLEQVRAHVPRDQGRKELPELEDDGDASDDVSDPFSSPVGGSGVVGNLVQRLLSRVRRLGGGGTPGADTPTHRSRSGARRGRAVTSTARTFDGDGPDGRRGRAYPEWDVHRRRYRPDWCTVHEIDAPEAGDARTGRPDVHALRRPLTRLGIGLDRCHRQPQGDDIDVDAAVEGRVGQLAGAVPDEAVYLDNLRRRRDLAVLVLLDVSGSVADAGGQGRTVHEQQRAVAGALAFALHELGDRVALFGFQSQGRAAVNMVPVKRFDDDFDTLVSRRLAGLVPGAYSRLGAAIRHGTAIIREEAGTSRRLLVVLSDGLAYDHGYERLYGAADARRALAEARRDGIGCLCLAVGAATGSGELARVFGSAAHAAIPEPSQLADHIGPLFRAALRSADTRRRIS